MDERDWELLYEHESKVLATLLKEIDPSLPFNEVAGLLYRHFAEHSGVDEIDAKELGKKIRELGFM